MSPREFLLQPEIVATAAFTAVLLGIWANMRLDWLVKENGLKP